MVSELPYFLIQWAHEPGPRKVLDAARARLEFGRLGPRSVLDPPLTRAERTQVGRLMPPSWVLSDAAVHTRELRDGLATHGVRIEDLLVALHGPLRDLPLERRAARASAAADRAEGVARLRGLLHEETVAVGAAADPDLNHDEAMDTALLRWVLRRAPARERADAVTRVVQNLPSTGDVGLPVLAARLFGDAHALDRSEPLGRAVARFLALRAGLSDFSDPMDSPNAWRAAWASGGVTCDTVSSQALVLNLPLVGDAPAVAWCSATPGEPTWLTLRSLQGAFGLATPEDVFVCENPSIVEAAATAFGAHTRPLVCTFGRPSTAFWTLLHGLAPEASLRVRADGDPAGWSIVHSIRATFSDAVAWRMPEDQTAYEEELLDELLEDLLRPESGMEDPGPTRSDKVDRSGLARPKAPDDSQAPRSTSIWP